MLKDWKIDTIHDLLELQQTLCLLMTSSRSSSGGVVIGSTSGFVDDVVLLYRPWRLDATAAVSLPVASCTLQWYRIGYVIYYIRCKKYPYIDGHVGTCFVIPLIHEYKRIGYGADSVKNGKLATKYLWTYGHFYSIDDGMRAWMRPAYKRCRRAEYAMHHCLLPVKLTFKLAIFYVTRIFHLECRLVRPSPGTSEDGCRSG